MSTRYSTVPPPLIQAVFETSKPARETSVGSRQPKLRLRGQAENVHVPGLEWSGSTIGVPQNGQETIEPPGDFERGFERHFERDFEPDELKARVTGRDLMRDCAATLRPEDSIERAAGLMTDNNGSVPVVDGAGRLIGMITDRDITVKLVAPGASIPHAQVSDCMTSGAFAASADISFESCVSVMAWHQVNQLPIVDDEQRILGTINRSDLLCYISEHPQTTELADILWALAF